MDIAVTAFTEESHHCIYWRKPPCERALFKNKIWGVRLLAVGVSYEILYMPTKQFRWDGIQLNEEIDYWVL